MTQWYSLPGFYQPLSSISHLVAAVVFAALSYPMLQRVWQDRNRFWCLAVFAGSAVTLLALSGIYHMFALGGASRALMLRIDVAAVFALIACSFTPIHGILFTGWKRWGVLAPIWIIAIVGLALRLVFFDLISRAWGAYVFLIMGWLGVVTAWLLGRAFGWRALWPLVLGGVFYSLGAISNVLRWPTIIPYVWGPHETHHFTVIAGLSCHWWLASQIANGAFVLQGDVEKTPI